MDKQLIVHVAEDVSPIAGGVPAVVRSSIHHLAPHFAARLIYARGEYKEADEDVTAVACEPGLVWDYSKRLRRELNDLPRLDRRGDALIHIHGIWQAPQFFAAMAGIKHQKKFLLTPHGMLDKWLWREQGALKRLKKEVYWHVAVKFLRAASVVHALTPLEKIGLAKLFPKKRIEVIPNGVQLAPSEKVCSYSSRQHRILFLGRLEPKKGVDILIEAFAAARLASDWHLDIVGPSWSATYSARLHRLVEQHRLRNQVTFHGPKFGAEKDAFLETAWAMIAPSHSEGLSLVNLEAGARGLPSITTPQGGLDDWDESGGFLVQPSVEAVAAALKHVASWSDSERADRGLASYDLVKRRYSWQAIVPQWTSLYRSL